VRKAFRRTSKLSVKNCTAPPSGSVG